MGPGSCRCARCGKDTECARAPGSTAKRCWCEDLPHVISPKAGEGCLCRPCLEKEIAARSK